MKSITLELYESLDEIINTPGIGGKGGLIRARKALTRFREQEDYPSIRRIAAVVGKSPSTVQRWQTTNPELFRAVSEYVARKQQSQGA